MEFWWYNACSDMTLSINAVMTYNWFFSALFYSRNRKRPLLIYIAWCKRERKFTENLGSTYVNPMLISCLYQAMKTRAPLSISLINYNWNKNICLCFIELNLNKYFQRLKQQQQQRQNSCSKKFPRCLN